MAKVSDADIERLRGVVGLGSQPQVAKPKGNEVELTDKPAQKSYLPDPTKDTQLFVKVEEHDQIIESLNDAKKDIKAIADTIELLARAEKLKADAIERMEQHIESFTTVVDSIESRIVSPEDVLKQQGSTEDRQQASKLSNELKSLRTTLEQLK